MFNYQNPLIVETKSLERGLKQEGRNDPSNKVSEGPTKKKGRFEIRETFTECSWNLEPVRQNMVTSSWATFCLTKH